MQTKEDPSLLQVVEDYHQRATATGSWIDWSTLLVFLRLGASSALKMRWAKKLEQRWLLRTE